MGVSRLAWMKIGEGEYLLPCGSSSYERDRTARLTIDLLGRFSITLATSSMEYPPVPLGTDLAKAFDEADKLIRITFPDCGPIVQASARWRGKPASEKQVELLRNMGVEEEVIGLLENMGQAKALIDQRKLGAGRKRRRPSP